MAKQGTAEEAFHRDRGWMAAVILDLHMSGVSMEQIVDLQHQTGSREEFHQAVEDMGWSIKDGESTKHRMLVTRRQ